MSASPQPIGAFPVVRKTAPAFEFILEMPPGTKQRIALRRVVTLLGTREGCKLKLKHPKVSPVHAAVINDGFRVWAVDLGSESGTKLNDLPLECEELADSDRLAIQGWTFRLRFDAGSGGTQIYGGDLDMEPEGVALEHVRTGKILKPNRTVCLIGRRQGCDIAIHEDRVSRVHALLFSYLGRPSIADLLTENGVYVNDERVLFRRLASGDVIGIGESRFKVHFLGAGVEVKPSKGNGKAQAPPVKLAPEEVPPDLIDIQDTEGSQKWQIADHLDEAERRRDAANQG